MAITGENDDDDDDDDADADDDDADDADDDDDDDDDDTLDLGISLMLGQTHQMEQGHLSAASDFMIQWIDMAHEDAKKSIANANESSDHQPCHSKKINTRSTNHLVVS